VTPPARYKDLCLDARDRVVVGRFWAAALGLELTDRGDGVALLTGPTPRHTVWVDEVPEPKTVKNRVHVDLYADEVAQLLARGATLLRPPGEGHDWHVLADPEGNEFCVFRP